MAKKGKKKPQKVMPTEASNNKSSIEQYQELDLVAAQVRGYPHWPGRIEAIIGSGKQLRYTVRFFPNNDTANLPPQAIIAFEEYHPKPASFKKKGFTEAFELCQRECDDRKASRDHDQSPPSPAASVETARSEVQSIQSGAQSGSSEPHNLPEKTEATSPEQPCFSPIAPPEENNSTPPTVVASDSKTSQPAETSAKVQDDDDTTKDQKTTKCDDDDKQPPAPEAPKAPVVVKSEKVSPQKAKRKAGRKSPTKLDTRTIDTNNKVLPKVEKDAPNFRDLTIKKLQSKIDAKMKEKDRMKQEQTEKKRLTKFTDKLMRINKKLAKFLNASQKLKQMISNGPQSGPHPKEWEYAADDFRSIHAALVKSIVFLTPRSRSDDLKICRDRLTELAQIFKKARKSGKLLKDTYDKTKLCLKLMKNSHIKGLINMNDYEFNAMIERKENSA